MFSLATKHDDAQASLGWGERLGYGCGQFGINLINAIMGSFFLVYCSSVAHLDVAIVSSIVAISKVFDGASDLIMGDIVDKTNSKMGKARVWLLRSCIPFAVATILLFFIPQNWPSMLQYVYLFIFYNLVSTVLFTAMFVPYASMTFLVSRNSYERGLLGNLSQIFSTLANVTINTFFLRLLGFFGGGMSEEYQYTQKAFFCTMTVVCVTMVIASLICVFSTKERVKDRIREIEDENAKSQKPSTWTAIKALLSNRYWVILTFCMFTVFFVVVMFSVAAIFYSQYVLGDANLFPYLSNAVSIAQFAIMFATPFFMKKFGRHKVYTVGIGLVLIGFIGFLFIGQNMTLIVLLNVLKGVGMGAAGGMSLGMVTDTIEYGIKKNGVDVAGMGNAGISAAQKLGLGLGTAVMGWVLDAGGFVDGAASQPDSAIAAINFCYTIIPLILMGITFILMLFFYKLDGRVNSESE